MVSARGLALHALIALQRGRSERLRSELESRGLEGRDLAFAYELAHGVVRRERLLDFALEGLAHRGLPKDPQLRTVLRLGAYQLLFVPGMPAHAAVHETVELVKANRGFANAILRNLARAVVDRPADPNTPLIELPLTATRTFMLARRLPADEVERLAIVHSLPDWLAARIEQQHGLDGLRRVGAAASRTPGIFLRLSDGVDRDGLCAELSAADVEVADCGHPRMLRHGGGASPIGTPPFKLGRFVIQDPTALRAAQAVPARPGHTVIDLCAAPGTKTTWLAEQVQPDGRVFAFDPSEPRRQRIVENVERLRFQNTVQVVDDVDVLPAADCVLADVPCSNSGVLGRRVEARRRLQPDTFATLARLQHELLERAVQLTKPGGHAVYATCSIDREENDDVVAAVRAAHPDLELLASETTLPLEGEHDGGYFAVLRRSPG